MKKLVISLLLAGGLTALQAGTMNLNTIGAVVGSGELGATVSLYNGHGLTGPTTPIANSTGADAFSFLAGTTAILGTFEVDPGQALTVLSVGALGPVSYEFNAPQNLGGSGTPPAPPTTVTGAGQSFELVPEPSTIALAIFGAAALLLRRRK